MIATIINQMAHLIPALFICPDHHAPAFVVRLCRRRDFAWLVSMEYLLLALVAAFARRNLSSIKRTDAEFATHFYRISQGHFAFR